MICTKTSTSENINPVIGFALYHNPTCALTLLKNGQLVTLAVVTMPLLPSAEELEKNDMENMTSPLKKVVYFLFYLLMCVDC